MAPTASLELLGRDYDAREAAGSTVLNRETGWLAGIAAAASIEGSSGRWTLQAGYERGTPTYHGLSQAGAGVRTTTELRVRRVALRWVPPWRPDIGRFDIDGHAELAHQRIDRDIRATAHSLPLRERVDATWLRAGATLGTALADDWTGMAEIGLSWPLSQRLGVDTMGIYDPFRLEPRRRVSDQFGVGIAWTAAPRLRVELWASGEHWRFGRSASRAVTREGAATGMADYPGSRQSLLGARLKLETRF